MDSRCACVGVRGVAGPSEVDEQVEAMLDELVLETREQAVSGAVVGGDGVSKALRMDRGEERRRPSRAGDSANGTGLGLRGVKGDCSSSGRRLTSGPCWSFHIEKVSGGGGARPDARLVSVGGVVGSVGDGGKSSVPKEDSLDVGLEQSISTYHLTD
jgi:hypothetical protein